MAKAHQPKSETESVQITIAGKLISATRNKQTGEIYVGDSLKFYKGEKKQGWRSCTECGGNSSGPKTKICHGCGHHFPASEPKEKSSKQLQFPLQSGPDTLAVVRFIWKLGGPDKAATAVQSVEIDDITKFVIDCGGVSEALTAIDRAVSDVA